MKELFENDSFLIAFTLIVIVITLIVAIAFSQHEEYKLKEKAIEHQCEKINDFYGYYYGNCKK